MGWFSEQIKTRIRMDEENFENAFAGLSSVLVGNSALLSALRDDRKKTQTAIEEILKFYHVKGAELPDGIEDLQDQLEFLLRPSGVMRRTVKLTDTWYRDGVGALLGRKKDGEIIAMLPCGMAGYAYFDYALNKQVKITKKNKDLIDDEAICFYKPLPLKSLTIRDLVTYIVTTLSKADYLLIAAATLATTLLGLFTPYVNRLLFSSVIPSGQESVLLPLACLLLGVSISTTLIGITRTLVMTRLSTKLSVSVQAAAMARVFSLPAVFFKDFASGDLASRTNSINRLCTMLVGAFLNTGLSSLFSIIYVGQIVQYAPSLAVPALCTLAVTLLFTVGTTLMQLGVTRSRMKLSAKLSGIVFALFSGIQKIKLGGAEKRAFSRWAQVYQQDAKLAYDPPLFIKLGSAFSGLISLAGMIFIYYTAVREGLGVADYMAFNVSYGMVSGAFAALAGIALTVAEIKPVLEMAEPLLKAEPEINENKRVVTRLSGAIELNNVSFRYTESMPMVVDDLSLKIRPGQYVAIVGPTGCGKSTLLRLMLGFETPEKGAVYYDGKDIQKLDAKSLRQHIGVVLQNGKLFTGDIYSNIVISAPWLSLDDAWDAAELAGIADDIRAMPMGMHTIIAEGGGGISGGQKQRLMIARAIAPKPRVLMFDEATSALDNITQKQVSESLDRLKSTRIVIAHRLSTIRQCDRIIVLDKGRIIEDGKYEQLIAKGGFFAELVKRQRVETDDDE